MQTNHRVPSRSAQLVRPPRVGLDGAPIRSRGKAPCDRIGGRLDAARRELLSAMGEMQDGSPEHVAAAQAVSAIDESLTQLTGVGL